MGMGTGTGGNGNNNSHSRTTPSGEQLKASVAKTSTIILLVAN